MLALQGDIHLDIGSGGIGQDELSGGNNDDALDGGAENDLLIHGIGADTFIYDGGNDTVRVFEDTIDAIQIAEAVYGRGLTFDQMFTTYGSIIGSDVLFTYDADNSLLFEDGIDRLTLVDEVSLI